MLQSLVALSAGDGDPVALANLTTQLADVTVSCDRLMENMGRIADQRAQIQKVQDVHVASALAMALRKLNGSYAKRTTELREARAQIDQYRAELEEAWRVAEDIAQEMDDLDNFHSGFSSDEDGGMSPHPHDESIRLAEVMNITGTAVATKATLTNLLTEPSHKQEFDRSSRVSAARRRSTRASKASLRIPKSPAGGATPHHNFSDRASVMSRRSRKSLRSRSVEDLNVPPVPPIRVDIPTRAATPTPMSPHRAPTPATELDVSMGPDVEPQQEQVVAVEPRPIPPPEAEASPPHSASARENFLSMSRPVSPGSPPANLDDAPPVPPIGAAFLNAVVPQDDATTIVPDGQFDATPEPTFDVVVNEYIDTLTSDTNSISTMELSVGHAKGAVDHCVGICYRKLNLFPIEDEEPAIQEVPRTPQLSSQEQIEETHEQSQAEQDQITPEISQQAEEPEQAQRSDRPPTLNFDIPPITVTQDDEIFVQDHSSDKAPTRSHSMVEPRTRSVDDTVIVPKRAKSEHKRFDGWPWQLGRKTKRYSMPLTRLSLDSAKGVVEKDKKKDKKGGSSSNLAPLPEGVVEPESSS